MCTRMFKILLSNTLLHVHQGFEEMQGIHCRGQDSSQGIVQPLKDEMELRYSLAHAIVKPGQVTQNHRLKTSEVYYILQGKGIMHIGRGTAEVRVGQAIYIPPNSEQRIKNTGKTALVFLCIVDPAWKKEDEEILPEK